MIAEVTGESFLDPKHAFAGRLCHIFHRNLKQLLFKRVCVCVSVCVGCDSYIWTSEGKHFTLCCTRNNEETLSTAVLLGACCIGVVASAVRC